MEQTLVKLLLRNMMLARKLSQLAAAFWRWNAGKLIEITGGRDVDFRERPFRLSLLVMDDSWYGFLSDCKERLLEAGVYLERRTI